MRTILLIISAAMLLSSCSAETQQRKLAQQQMESTQKGFITGYWRAVRDLRGWDKGVEDELARSFETMQLGLCETGRYYHYLKEKYGTRPEWVAVEAEADKLEAAYKQSFGGQTHLREYRERGLGK